MVTLQFYAPAGERARANLSRKDLAVLGLTLGKELGYAVLSGDPYHILLSHNLVSAGKGTYNVADATGRAHSGYAAVPHHKGAEALRIERASTNQGYMLPDNWKGEARVVESWEGGVILELVGYKTLMPFKKAPVQQLLAI
jgi:hypothetical protein